VQSYGLAVDLAVRFIPSGKRALIGTMRGPEEQRPEWLFRLDGLTSWRLRGYISNSACGKTALVQKGRVAPGRIQVIPNGIDPAAFSTPRTAAARQRLRSEFQAGEADILVLTVANLHAAKGHEDIIRAMATLDPRHRMRFLFAGEDRSGGRLARLADELGVRPRILFLGHRTDVAELMAASDVFLLASHWEGMSNALMEAMCASLPAIATDVGAAGELLDTGRCGQLIPSKNPAAIAAALSRHAASRTEALDMAAAARLRIHERYSIQAMVRAHEGFYEGLFR
jgi:glycosyltransferase involved in cell wall biosynthesis